MYELHCAFRKKKGERAEIHNEYEEYIIAIYAFVHISYLHANTRTQNFTGIFDSVSQLTGQICLTKQTKPYTQDRVLEKPVATVLIKKFLARDPNVLLLLSYVQEPATCPCLEPDESNHALPTHFPKHTSNTKSYVSLVTVLFYGVFVRVIIS